MDKRQNNYIKLIKEFIHAITNEQKQIDCKTAEIGCKTAEIGCKTDEIGCETAEIGCETAEIDFDQKNDQKKT
jgi:hypothetical protein